MTRGRVLLAALAAAAIVLAGVAYARNASTTPPVTPTVTSTVTATMTATMTTTVTATVTATVTRTVTASPAATTPRARNTATPPRPPAPRAPSAAGFPSAATTGVPAGTSLTAYRGSLTVSAPNTTIRAKRITGDLHITAAGATITDTVVNGTVSVDGAGTLTISDSEIHVPVSQETALSASNFTATRVEFTGGNRGVLCDNHCTVQDSWVHGQTVPSDQPWHASGFRASQYTTFRHNTIECDAPQNSADGGCSAPLTMYGDWAPVQFVTVDHNLIGPSPDAAYCAYGGSSAGKPYSTAANHVVYTDNVFAKGPNGECALYDALTDFDPTAPGNVLRGNRYTDGTPVR